MRVLLDTHAFLWWIADSGRLSLAARQVIADETNDIVVSASSAGEITTKYRIGKLPGAEAVALDVAGAISAQGGRPSTRGLTLVYHYARTLLALSIGGRS